MSIFPKPFSIANKMRNRIFGPKPSVFADQDINQESEAILYGIENNAKRLGACIEGANWVENTLTINEVSNPGFAEADYSIDFNGTVAGNTGFYVYHKNVRFFVPNQNITNIVQSVWPNAQKKLPRVEFFLVAEKTTITFGADPVKAGVNGPGFPGPYASSEPVEWGNEQIVEVVGGVFPVLAGNLEYVCKIAWLGYEKIFNQSSFPTSAFYTHFIRLLRVADLGDMAKFEKSNSTDVLVRGANANSIGESLANAWSHLKELTDKTDSQPGIFTGTILPIMYSTPMNPVPVGFLECDGTTLNRTTYSNLFNTISFRFIGTFTNGGGFITGVPLLEWARFALGMRIDTGGFGPNAIVTDLTTPGSVGIGFATGFTGATFTGASRAGNFNFGDYATTYVLPDMRGNFLRGHAFGGVLDGNFRNIGSQQRSTKLGLLFNENSNGSLGNGHSFTNYQDQEAAEYSQYTAHRPDWTYAGGSSNTQALFGVRPRNISVNFIIKY